MAYNLQGIIRKGTINITNEFQRLGYITQNVANYNTNGYKAVRFEEILDADGTLHGVERVDTKQGEYIITGNPLDVALTVSGYIPVTTPQGEIRYTRDGSFSVDKDGYLVTKTGDLVGSGIQIDGTAEKIEIKKNGDIYTYKRLIDKPEYVGSIPVVQFKNPSALKDAGANEFVATEDAGEMTLAQGENLMKQNGVEFSNVDLIKETYKISRINASILATSSLMKAVNTMYNEAIQLTD